MKHAITVLALTMGAPALAQTSGNVSLLRTSNGKLSFNFEIRSRAESRNDQSFGLEPDLVAHFVRTRLGATWRPSAWIKFSALGQDARAPFYGQNAPGTARDPFDLQEGYAELFPESSGFGMSVGRRMIQYGDTRLIGSPQWAYTARTYDHAQVYWRTKRMRFEALFASPIKPRGDGFNRPVLGDRAWGTYNTFRIGGEANLLDVYALRHDQNAPGGFRGPGRLRTNTAGLRWAGRPGGGFRYTFEGALQGGRIGTAVHRAGAWVGMIGRRISAGGKGLDLSTEFKYASGTSGSRPDRSGTFDQLYPAAHDKFGHADLIGWRNNRNIKSIATLELTRSVSLTAMYDNTWLASATDSLYNAQGRAIARSATGLDGTHVGQEIDVIAAWKSAHYQFAAGVGKFFAGEFLRNTSPGLNTLFLYISNTLSF